MGEGGEQREGGVESILRLRGKLNEGERGMRRRDKLGSARTLLLVAAAL